MLKIGLSLPFLATVSRAALAEKAGLIKTQGSGSSAGWLWTYVCSPVPLFLNLGPCHVRPQSEVRDGSVRIKVVTTV